MELARKSRRVGMGCGMGMLRILALLTAMRNDFNCDAECPAARGTGVGCGTMRGAG